MKTVLFTILFFIPLFIFSQQWCPAGATWYYDYSAFNASGTTQIKYIKDTTINSKTYKILRDSTVYISGWLPTVLDYTKSYLYTRMSNDSIYFLDQGIDQFAYRFNPALDDSFINNNIICTDTFATCWVSKIDSISLNGNLFHTQKINHNVPNFPILEFDSLIVADRIGPISQGYIFPFLSLCSEYDYYYFRCYSDNDLQTTTDTNCNYFPNGINKKLIESIQLSFYPNPVRDEIHIQFLNLNSNIYNFKVRIYDILGNLQSCSPDIELNSADYIHTFTIPTKDLTNGVYFLTISDNNFMDLKTTKFVKE